MAIEIGRINTKDLIQNNYKIIGIGINKKSNTNGIFSTNFTTIDQAKSNLINLIMTKKGERLMMPDFGCDIWNVLFEPIIDGSIKDKIENTILDAANSWMPEIEISDIQVNTDNDLIDGNRIEISIGFSMAINPNITDTVQIILK